MIQDYKYSESMINVTVTVQLEAGRIKINNVFKLGKNNDSRLQVQIYKYSKKLLKEMVFHFHIR